MYKAVKWLETGLKGKTHTHIYICVSFLLGKSYLAALRIFNFLELCVKNVP